MISRTEYLSALELMKSSKKTIANYESQQLLNHPEGGPYDVNLLETLSVRGKKIIELINEGLPKSEAKKKDLKYYGSQEDSFKNLRTWVDKDIVYASDLAKVIKLYGGEYVKLYKKDMSIPKYLYHIFSLHRNVGYKTIIEIYRYVEPFLRNPVTP
jgi:hypothetical protein